MKYDFSTQLNRNGMDSIAVNIPDSFGFMKDVTIEKGYDLIPMWVADMNFTALPKIQEAMITRAKHGAFGYFQPRDEYYNSIIRWQELQNGVEGLTKECIGYENGVLGGVISALNVFCSKGEKILVHSPTYIGFTEALSNNGYRLIGSPLVQDAEGIWRIDFEDMEDKLRKHKIHAAVFCSPHNPCGRVWEKWELEKVMALYQKYDVYVVSDEIWSDLTLEQYHHIPVQSISEDARNRTVAMYAPSKTFNLAGLVGAYHIVYNPWIRERMEKESSLSHYNEMNVLSMYALIGAYSPEGQEWVDELRQVLSENATYAYDFFTSKVKGISVAKPQGTYMLLLDCEEWCKEHQMTIEQLQKAGMTKGVIWQDGRPFHSPYGIRLNLALPQAKVVEAMNRLKEFM